MALKIKRETPYGAFAEYWKVTYTSVDWCDKCFNFTVAGYLNQQAASMNLQPLIIQEVRIDEADFTISDTTNLLKNAYEILKTKIEFGGALDV